MAFKSDNITLDHVSNDTTYNLSTTTSKFEGITTSHFDSGDLNVTELGTAFNVTTSSLGNTSTDLENMTVDSILGVNVSTDTVTEAVLNNVSSTTIHDIVHTTTNVSSTLCEIANTTIEATHNITNSTETVALGDDDVSLVTIICIVLGTLFACAVAIGVYCKVVMGARDNNNNSILYSRIRHSDNDRLQDTHTLQFALDTKDTTSPR